MVAGNRGTFGEPIRRSIGSTWTRRELQAIQRAAGSGSRAKVIRGLIDADKLAALIHRTEAAARASRGN